MATSKPNKISIKRTIRKGRAGSHRCYTKAKVMNGFWCPAYGTLCAHHTPSKLLLFSAPGHCTEPLCSHTLNLYVFLTFTLLCTSDISFEHSKTNTIYVTVSYFKQLNHFPAFQRYTEHFYFFLQFIYKTQCECSSCVLRALYPSCISINCDCNPISCNGCYIIDRWSLLPTEPEVIHMKLFIVQILR